MEKNYKSDFHFIMKIKTCNGKDVGWPDFDWTATLWTSTSVNALVVSRHGDRTVNCFNDNGQIHVVVKGGRLGKGRVNMEFHAELPDAIYPDGKRNEYKPQPLEIVLVDGPGDCPTEIEVEVMLPYIKGKDAYEYATDAGYDGTEADFADALANVGNKEDSFTLSDDLQMSEGRELSVTEKAKREVFDDMWREAVGSKGTIDHTHKEDGKDAPYYLYGLWFNYDEAVTVFMAGRLEPGNAKCKFMGNNLIRTTLPPGPALYVSPIALTHKKCTRLETVDCGTYLIPSETNFSGCIKLRKIANLFSINSNSVELYGNLYFECSALEQITFNIVYPYPFSLQWSPLLDISTFQNIVAKYNNTKNITVTVHPDVYAKLTGDTTNAAAAALTAEELEAWGQVLTDALAKNITFATV